MAIIDLDDIPDFVHTEATWEQYEELLDATQDRRLRITYDRGQLEIVPPSFKHEGGKERLGRLLDALMDERRIPNESGGALTMRRRVLMQGIEPDKSYWIANVDAMADRDEWLPERDPPPDLAIEVDVSRSSINRLGIYANFGVPEVWRYRKGRITVYHLSDQRDYKVCEASPTFPDIPIEVVERFMAMRMPTAKAVWAFQDWLRSR